MIPNIFSKLAFGKNQEAEVDTEALAAEQKVERIKFHRESVRNGPVRWKGVTNGQVKRAQRRELARSQKKARRAEVRNYFERQRFAAVLRGHLQTIGLLPFHLADEAPLEAQVASTVWIVHHFGSPVEQTGRVSFKEGDVLTALRAAGEFYGKATGYPVEVPEGFVPAIVLAEDAA